MRDSAIIYRSFYEAVKDLPKETQAEVWAAVCEFSFNETSIKLSGISKTVFTLIKPQLEANNKRYKNGCQPKSKQEESKPEANQKRSRSKPEANKNDNKNDNKNENLNSNGNEKGYGDKSPELLEPIEKQKIYSRCMDIYYQWFKGEFDALPKIDGAQGKAMVSIILYIKSDIKDKNKSAPLTDEQMDDNTANYLSAIFKNWRLLNDYCRSRTKLNQIYSELQNIIAQIKNHKAKSNEQPTEKIGRVTTSKLEEFRNRSITGT